MFRPVSAKASERAPHLFTGGIIINLDGRRDRHFLIIMSAQTSAIRGSFFPLKKAGNSLCNLAYIFEYILLLLNYLQK